MVFELIFATTILAAVLLLAGHAWWSQPVARYMPETIDVGHVANALPPPKRHDVLDDYAAQLNFEAFTTEGSAEHRLALLESLLEEADQETSRLELLVDRMGRKLAPAA